MWWNEICAFGTEITSSDPDLVISPMSANLWVRLAEERFVHRNDAFFAEIIR